MIERLATVFRAPHVSFVSFAIEITPIAVTETMVLETDLHLNSRHQAYNRQDVQNLIAAAQEYLAANAAYLTQIRLVSNQAGEI